MVSERFKDREAEYTRRVVCMAECLEDAARMMRQTLEANPGDIFGLKMRLAEAQGALPLIADLTSRLVELRRIAAESEVNDGKAAK